MSAAEIAAAQRASADEVRALKAQIESLKDSIIEESELESRDETIADLEHLLTLEKEARREVEARVETLAAEVESLKADLEKATAP